MPKNKLKAKKSRKKPSKRFIKALFGCFVLLLSAVIAFGLVRNSEHVCANSISCVRDLSGKYEESSEAIYLGRKMETPPLIADSTFGTRVLGESTSARHIYVDLSNQKLYAYDGNTLVYQFLVSTGKWNHTPTGDFNIWIKLRYTRMSGGSGADYYDLPNVPYTMFYANSKVPRSDGYSIHGAYWHNNFGHPMSHGCVNMRPEDAQKIYDFANPPTLGNVTYATADNPGTVVTIYGETPAY